MRIPRWQSDQSLSLVWSHATIITLETNQETKRRCPTPLSILRLAPYDYSFYTILNKVRERRIYQNKVGFMKPFGRVSNAMVVTFSGATSIHPPRSFHPSMNDVVHPTSFIVSCNQSLSRVPFGLSLEGLQPTHVSCTSHPPNQYRWSIRVRHHSSSAGLVQAFLLFVCIQPDSIHSCMPPI